MAQTKKVFDAGSPGFIASIITAVLTITGIAGIEYPQLPADIADQLVSTFNESGVYAVVGILIVNIVAPIWNFIRKKEKLNWKNVLGSVTTWLSLAGVAISGFLLFNLEIPTDAPGQIAGAITARNWSLLGSLLVVTVIVPVIRWIRDRKQAV